MAYNNNYLTRARSQRILCANPDVTKCVLANAVVTIPAAETYTNEAADWTETGITDTTVKIPQY